jgi:energy-coupling factor transport system permease protein
MIGASRIGYRRRASPLHAARAPVAAAYGLALAAAALTVGSPILLGALLLATLGAATGAGVARELLATARASALPIVLLTVVVNALVSRGGLTVFARLGDWGPLGQVNLTVEAVVYGAVSGLRLLVVLLACTLVMCVADPDELLRACRRVLPRSALAAVLSTRMIGVLGADASRLAEAQRCRPDGGAGGALGKLAILRATVGGALDRSLDVAAVLEMRGYGGSARPARARRAWSRHDLAFAAAAAGLVLVAALDALSGAARFQAYPLLGMSSTPAALGLAGGLLVIALAPFLDHRGIGP